VGEQVGTQWNRGKKWIFYSGETGLTDPARDNQLISAEEMDSLGQRKYEKFLISGFCSNW